MSSILFSSLLCLRSSKLQSLLIPPLRINLGSSPTLLSLRWPFPAFLAEPCLIDPYGGGGGAKLPDQLLSTPLQSLKRDLSSYLFCVSESVRCKAGPQFKQLRVMIYTKQEALGGEREREKEASTWIGVQVIEEKEGRGREIALWRKVRVWRGCEQGRWFLFGETIGVC